MDAPPRKSCGSTMGDIISSVSYQYQAKDSVFKKTEALSELSFDGTKSSLAVSLGNSLAKKALRDYGLPHVITHIINHLPDIHECEQLTEKDQILILHDNNLLIRIVNTSTKVKGEIIQIEIEAILNRLQDQDTMTHAKLVQERITHEVKDLANSWIETLTPHFPRVMTALAMGAVAGAVTYIALQ